MEWKEDDDEGTNASPTSLEEEANTNNTHVASTITPAINPFSELDTIRYVHNDTPDKGEFSSDGRGRIQRPPT